MKQPKNVPPLKYNARLMNAGNAPSLEWSRPTGEPEHGHHAHLDDHDEQPQGHGASAFFQKLKGWIDRCIGAHHDEIQMLRRLHKAERLEIAIEQEHGEIAPHLENYWRQRHARHNRRMLVAGILVLPAALLTIIPGPNVVGLAVAYITWHHWRIVQGVKRVRSGAIPVEIKRVAGTEEQS